MPKQRNPWTLKVWLILLNGVPFDWKHSRSLAFQRAAAYRREHPHSTWAVKLGSGRLLLTEMKP